MDEEHNFTQQSTSNIAIVWAAIASVGWYIVAVVVTLFCASPYIGEKYQNWRAKKDEEEYSAKYHKNPELFEQRMTAVEATRRRMQEKYNQQAALIKQKEEERKELKRQELLKLTSDRGPSTSKPSTLHNDYNPLMGDSSRGYRPPKRSCCGKGCG